VLHHLYQQQGQDDFQLLWQTGNYHYNLINTNEKIQNRENIHIVPFIDRMDLAYAAADIIISRAGAIAISELCIIGKPVILIPSPNVAEDHQTKNAVSLVKKSAALMVKDAEAVEYLFETVNKLAGDNMLQEALGKHIKTLARPEAAGVIAGEAMKLVRKNKTS
jgi:UDP-N-acetylglucosamine--N-acetylmuramyl-(pentapeptide) pyrophosphoryl-undecaprenol N-acetylglucosamine transferase